jgi:hypothetical protein
MALITTQRDPSNISALEIYQVDGQVNLKDWLIENLTHDFGGLHAVIKLNSKVIADTVEQKTKDNNKAINIDIGLLDRVHIVLRPKGIDPYTTAIYFAVAIVAAGVAIALAPKPNLRNLNDSRTGGSNNQLNASGNSYRPYQAIPDIGGQVISYPDFAQPSYYEYNPIGARVYTEFFIIGVGQYDVVDVKEGDTPFIDAAGYEAEVLPQGLHPTELKRVIVNPSSQDVDLLSSSQQRKVIQMEDQGGTVTLPNILNIGAGNVAFLQLTSGDLISANLTVRDAEPLITNLSFDATVDTVVGGVVTLLESVIPDNAEILSGTITNKAFTPEHSWYTLSGDAIEEVWFHLRMPTGIRRGDNTDASVTITLTIEELDGAGLPTGTTYSRGAVFTGNTQEPQAGTFKFTQAMDGITVGKYRARAIRITPYLGDNSLDLVSMDGIASMTTYSPNWGDVTALKVIRASRQRVDRGGSNKINALVTRKLRIYDHITGIYGATYEATRRFCDYAFYLLHELMQIPIAQINTAELFGIHGNLTDAQLGYFDGTFDDKDISARDRLESICNAARVRYWNDGLTWSFVREEAQQVRALMFNRRNLAPASGVFQQTFKTPNDYDSVTVIYVNPENNTEKRISKKIENGVISDGVGNRPLEFNFKVGIRSDFQAMNRLNLEVRRLLYRPVTVEDTALDDALLARLGVKCAWVDLHDQEVFSGEVSSVSGNVYGTTERFMPESGFTYYVYISLPDGSVSNSVIATARSDGSIFGFEATGLAGAYTASGIVQAGSRYYIIKADDLLAQDFVVQSRGVPSESGQCAITLSEYVPELFEAD